MPAPPSITTSIIMKCSNKLARVTFIFVGGQQNNLLGFNDQKDKLRLNGNCFWAWQLERQKLEYLKGDFYGGFDDEEEIYARIFLGFIG